MPPTPTRPQPTITPRYDGVDPAKRKTVIDAIKARLKPILPANQPISANTQKEVDKTVDEVIEQRISAAIAQSAQREASQLLWNSADIPSRIAEIAKLAGDAASTIASNGDFLKSIKENAKIQRAKYDAYVAEKFSPAEAMELLKAELYSKARLKM